MEVTGGDFLEGRVWDWLCGGFGVGVVGVVGRDSAWFDHLSCAK